MPQLAVHLMRDLTFFPKVRNRRPDLTFRAAIFRCSADPEALSMNRRARLASAREDTTMVESTGGASPTREREGVRGSQGSPGSGQEKSWGGGGQAGEASRAGENAGWADQAASKTKEVAKDVAEEAKSLGKRVTDKAKDWAHTAGETAKDWAHTAGEKVDEARTSVGGGLQSFGSGIREKGSSASTVVGEKLEAAGNYLREHDFSGMADSMKDVVRRHPVQSVFVGIGLGFVLARAMRGRN
jgi:ElaB/YqjD/DUF883 family membrane-anchored ribosome-binding protein